MSQKIWFHGTESNISITDWIFPPPATHKPELFPHSMIFLASDLELAKKTGPKIYSASLTPNARVFDVRKGGNESEALRLEVIKGPYGRDHDYALHSAYWKTAWDRGIMMRFGSTKPEREKVNKAIVAAMENVRAGKMSLQDQALILKGQNMTRAWIEEIGVAARTLGYDALIGNEIISEPRRSSVVCEVLFALTEKAITPPASHP